MTEPHTFGLSGRTRRVEDAGNQILPTDGLNRTGVLRRTSIVRVGRDDLQPLPSQHRRILRQPHAAPNARIGHELAQTRFGISWVERQIRFARPQNGQYADDHV